MFSLVDKTTCFEGNAEDKPAAPPQVADTLPFEQVTTDTPNAQPQPVSPESSESSVIDSEDCEVDR